MIMHFFEFLKKEPIHILWLLYAIFGLVLEPMKTKVLDNRIVISSIIVMLSSLYSLLIAMKNTRTEKIIHDCRRAFLLVGVISLVAVLYFYTEWHDIVNISVAVIIILYSFACYLLQFMDEDFKTKTDKDVKKNIDNKSGNNKAIVDNKEISL